MGSVPMRGLARSTSTGMSMSVTVGRGGGGDKDKGALTDIDTLAPKGINPPLETEVSGEGDDMT
jgi:hypothetical protein